MTNENDIVILLMEQNTLLREILEATKVRKQKKKSDYELLYDFDAAYKLYPRKEGKTAGFQKLATTIKTKEQYDLFMLAVKRYKEKIERDKTEKKFILHFSTFAGRWQDYLPLPETREPQVRRISQETLLL